MLFHATIITQTVALIFSQIDQNKIQSRLPVGHFLFTFPLLWKYKTDLAFHVYPSHCFVEVPSPRF